MKLALAKVLAYICSLFVSPNPKQWNFYITPSGDLEGNQRALLDYVLAKGHKQVLIESGKETVPDWVKEVFPDTELIQLGDFRLRSIIRRLQCGVMIVTHDLPRNTKDPLFFARHARVVNLWHGTPLKAMGNLSETCKEKDRRKIAHSTHKQHMLICGSENERATLSGCFFWPGEKVKITGLPRNDWLLCDIDSLPNDLRTDHTRLTDELQGRKLILYAPTWRNEKKHISHIIEMIRELSLVATSKGAILGLRLHPKEKELTASIRQDSTLNWLDLSSSRYRETNIILRQVNILITDYSSIWVDFLLMNKPIIGYNFDQADYEYSRGLLYNYEGIFPGPLCTEKASLFHELTKALTPSLPIDNLAIKRSLVTLLLHRHKGLSSCTRVCEQIDCLFE